MNIDLVDPLGRFINVDVLGAETKGVVDIQSRVGPSNAGSQGTTE